MSAWRLVPCEPVGTEPVRAIFRGPWGDPVCRLVERPRYARRAEASRLNARRRELGLGIEAAASRLGLSVTDFILMLRGAVDLADPADWPQLLAALESEARP